MAFLGLKVPPETARLFAEIDVPGEKSAPSAMHITMVYLGKEVPIETIAATIPVVMKVVSGTRPFSVQTSHVSTFPAGDDGVPIIARVQSNDLHRLRNALLNALDAASIPYNKKFPEFKPHVTLAFSKDPLVEEIVNIDIPTIEWGAHELVLWGGDQGDKRIIVTFPFSIAMTKAAVDRSFVQLATRWPAGNEQVRKLLGNFRDLP